MNQHSVNLTINLVKTRPPHPGDKLVARDCLDLLTAAHAKPSIKLMVIEAAAGAGKSTLLLQLYQQLESKNAALAWLSLGGHDHDPVSLLNNIASALQSQLPQVGNACLALLRAGAGIPPRTMLTTLFNEILAYGHSITLFLDDLHLCASQQNRDLLQSILEDSPANLRLVMASRTLPGLSLNKLAARGQLLHLSTRDLRVSHQDANTLFRDCYGLDINEDDRAVLLNRTDGWINGLQIAALSLTRCDDKKGYINRLNGSQRDMSDYIEEDIYVKLPAEIQTFLACTSVLDEFNPQLCDAITLNSNGQEMINQIIKLNLFIIQLDEQNNWYRYHHLFGDFLRQQLLSLPKQKIHDLHQRAYRWCLENNLFSQAVDHALTCQDWRSASIAIEACRVELMTNNRLATLANWVDGLPQEVVDSRPIILLILGWHHAMKRNFSLAKKYLQQVITLWANTRHDTNSQPAIFEKEIAALGSVITINRDDWQEVFQLSDAPLVSEADRDDVFDNVYHSVMIYAHVFVGRFDKAHRLAVQQSLLAKDNNMLASVYCFIFSGWGYRQSGDLKSALQQYQQAGLAASNMFADKWGAFCVPQALMMELYYEWDMLDEAVKNKPNLHDLVIEAAFIDPIICSHITHSRTLSLAGDHAAALQILAEGESFGKREACTRITINMLSERVWLLLKMDRLQAAQQAANDLYDVETASQETEQSVWLDSHYQRDITRVRLELFNHSIEHSLTLLAPYIDQAKREARHYPLVNLLILKALVLNRLGKTKTAHKHMVEAVGYAATGKLIRTFKDAGSEAHELLTACLGQWELHAGMSSQSVDGGYLKKLKKSFSVIEENPVEDTDLLENYGTLTHREKELMLHLSFGLKNKQLAQKLSLSENTIAWHLKNLYSKLGVSNRTAAANVARKLNKL